MDDLRFHISTKGCSQDKPPAFDQGDSAGGDSDCRRTRILVVVDDFATRQMVIEYLNKDDMFAIPTYGQSEMVRRIVEREPNLIVLDVDSRRDDGFGLLRELRRRSDVPTIAITGNRCHTIDRVVAFELGADHCLSKPFHLPELVARIRALLRRQNQRTAPERLTGGERYRFGSWELNRGSRRVIDPKGIPVRLTKGAFALLLAFLDAPGRPLTRQYLLQATRVHDEVFERSIDVQVLRLRRKLEIEPTRPRFIQTVRGVGYVFAQPVTRQ
jgi:two-component system, OmpR family, response regulator